MQVVGESIGLTGMIYAMRRLARGFVKVTLFASKGGRRHIAESRGDGNSGSSVDHFTGDAIGMTEPVPEVLTERIQVQAGFGNLDLDVRAPVVLIGVRGAIGLRGRLHGLQLVQKAVRDHLASESVPDHVRRN